jgi:hypothetical protein
MELQNRIIGVVGRKGSGKSTLAKRILEHSPRVFVFDNMGEHNWVPNTFRDLNDADEFLAWADMQEAFAGRYIPEDDISRDFADLATIAYQQGNLLLAVEEIPLLCSASHIPPELGRLVRLGRHKCVSMLWTAQRMAEVSRTLTAMTDYFVLFAASEPRDVDAIRDRCGAEVAEKTSSLGLHEFLIYDVIGHCELDAGEAAMLAEVSQKE